jgi:hypothetical protein
MRRHAGAAGNGTGSAAVTAKSPDSMSVEQLQELPVSGGRGSVTPGSASTGQQQAPQLFKRKINQDSSTVFPLCKPIPGKHYSTTKYFSGPYIFISHPVRAPRVLSCPGSKYK